MSKILIVDDDATNRYLIRAILQHSGYDIIEAESGAEGLDAARAHRPDLVIIDLSMPGMNGAAFMKHLRADEAIAHLRVALYTATMIDGAMRDFMEMTRIAHLIPKPSEPLEVIRIVEAALA